MAVNDDVRALVGYAVRTGIIEAEDATWARNRLLGALGADGCAEDGGCAAPEAFDLEAVIARLGNAFVAAGREEDTPSGHDRAETELMGLIMQRPSEINARFRELLAGSGATAATDWFYRLCCDVRYVREAAIARNESWSAPTEWGDLEITINLSKPEKDPAAIAAVAGAPAGEQYPACQLCVENEGYFGRGGASPFGAHPARQNLRVIPVELGGERWGFQYSPYAYFEEHCIFMSEEHRPMKIDRANLSRLLDIVDLFPHYFVGSNADLPIVGGSILNHDHFQGGRHEFPMMRAQAVEEVGLAGYPDVACVLLKWPLTTLRLLAADRGRLLDAACGVTDAWRAWSDPAAGVLAFDADGTPHNTVTPTARKAGGVYEMCLVLRCNITSDEHPLGVFHPHEDKWHVKKENIGIIEAMGMAILPPRLMDELDEGRIDRDEIGRVFAGVLEDSGVYKWDDAGREALARFLRTL